MKIKDGKVQFEEVKCWDCKGVGKRNYYMFCPRESKRTDAKAKMDCCHCGVKKGEKHKMIPYSDDCKTCHGTGRLQEDRYSYDHEDKIKELPFRVIRHDVPQTLNETHLGLGCVYCCTDYGRHKELTDKQLIEQVRNNISHTQYCNFVDEENNLADAIAIVTSRGGFSVTAMYL